MTTVLREISLKNGLTIRFRDHTRHYFGDFHQVRLEIVCDIRLDPAHFENITDFEDARRILGEGVSYRRFVEQMGVPTASTGEVKEQLIAHFVGHSLKYVSSSVFPQRLVQAELERARGNRLKSSRFLLASHD